MSTHGQAEHGNSLQDQKDRLLSEGVPEQNIAVDVYTGTKMDRPGFGELVRRLQAGDELVVCKLDRFARSATEGNILIRQLVDKGIKVSILNLGMVADNTPMGKATITFFLAFAELERDMIVERTQAGKAVARTKPDYHEGRPRKQIDAARFDRLARRVQDGEISQTAACQRIGVSPATFSRRYREWRAATTE